MQLFHFVSAHRIQIEAVYTGVIYLNSSILAYLCYSLINRDQTICDAELLWTNLLMVLVARYYTTQKLLSV